MTLNPKHAVNSVQNVVVGSAKHEDPIRNWCASTMASTIMCKSREKQVFLYAVKYRVGYYYIVRRWLLWRCGSRCIDSCIQLMKIYLNYNRYCGDHIPKRSTVIFLSIRSAFCKIVGCFSFSSWTNLKLSYVLYMDFRSLRLTAVKCLLRGIRSIWEIQFLRRSVGKCI